MNQNRLSKPAIKIYCNDVLFKNFADQYIMTKKIINFVLTGDCNYVTQLGVTMYSVLRNLSKDFYPQFYLIVMGWDENDYNKINRLKQYKDCDITFINPENYFDYFNSQNREFLVYYSRLLIPKVLPESVDKCFFIDGDMIIDDDLGQLDDVLSDEQICAAVVDSIYLVSGVYKSKVEQQFSYLSSYDEFCKFNKNKLSAPYFNAGFMILNLRLMRELNVFSSFMSFLSNHKNPPFRDQDVLNAVFGQQYSEKMVYLPLKWNYQCAVKYDIETCMRIFSNSYNEICSHINKPSVYHYSGDSKPWFLWNDTCKAKIYKSYEIAYIETILKESYKREIKNNIYIRLFSVIPFLRIEHDFFYYSKKIFLFDFLPVYSKKASRSSLYLFSPIILLSVRKKDNETIVLLFNFIKLLSIHKNK